MDAIEALKQTASDEEENRKPDSSDREEAVKPADPVRDKTADSVKTAVSTAVLPTAGLSAASLAVLAWLKRRNRR